LAAERGGGERFWVGVGEWTVRFAVAIGVSSSRFGMTAGVRFMDGSESQLNEHAVVGSPRSIICGSASKGDRIDLPAAADVDLSTAARGLSSILTLPLLLRPESPLSFLPWVFGAFKLNEVVDVFHVTFEGVPGREETAIGWNAGPANGDAGLRLPGIEELRTSSMVRSALPLWSSNKNVPFGLLGE
jgi:hypothetical protein